MSVNDSVYILMPRSYDYSIDKAECTLKSAGLNTGETISAICTDATTLHVERDLPGQDLDGGYLSTQMPLQRCNCYHTIANIPVMIYNYKQNFRNKYLIINTYISPQPK
jgi:hypothetical protein